MKIKFYCIILFLSGCLFSSDNSTVSTHTVAGVPVQIVERLEVEPDENGVQIDTFVPAQGNEIQEVVEILENNQEIQNDLTDAVLATVEIDRQEGEAYITIKYQNGDTLIDRLY